METGAINSPLMHSYFDRLQDAIDDVGIPPSPGYAVSCLPSEFLDGLQLVEFFVKVKKRKPLRTRYSNIGPTKLTPSISSSPLKQ